MGFAPRLWIRIFNVITERDRQLAGPGSPAAVMTFQASAFLHAH